jgi:hypothetical protein
MSYAKGFNKMEGAMLPQRQIFNPIKVTVFESDKYAGKPVAFIGGQLCYFERHETQPVIGSTIEVMISRPVWGDYVGPTEPKRMYGVLLRVVDREKHQPVLIKGFERGTNLDYLGQWFKFVGEDDTGNHLIEPDIDVATGDSDIFHIGRTEAKLDTELWGWANPNDEGEFAELLGITTFADGAWEGLVKK